MGLYSKIYSIMSEVQYLKDDKEINFGGGKGYKIISEEKVFQAIRDKFIEHKLIIIPITMKQSSRPIGILETEKGPIIGKSTLTEIETSYKLIDIESGEFETISSCGAGEHTLDQGISKAITKSLKNLLLKLFIIPTGDRPDNVDSDVQFGSKPMNQAPEEEKIIEPEENEDPKKTTGKKAKLTMEIVGEVLTEFMNTMGYDDMIYVKKEILTPCGSDKLSKILPEKYPDIVNKVNDLYLNSGIKTNDIKKFNLAMSLIYEKNIKKI